MGFAQQIALPVMLNHNTALFAEQRLAGDVPIVGLNLIWFFVRAGGRGGAIHRQSRA